MYAVRRLMQGLVFLSCSSSILSVRLLFQDIVTLQPRRGGQEAEETTPLVLRGKPPRSYTPSFHSHPTGQHGAAWGSLKGVLDYAGCACAQVGLQSSVTEERRGQVMGITALLRAP